MTPQTHHIDRNSDVGTRLTAVVAAVVAITLLLIASQSVSAVAILLIDGATAILIVAVLSLAGTWIVPLLQIEPLPLRWHLLIGVGTGLGVMPAVLLAIGLAGLLRPTVILIPVVGAVLLAIAAALRLANLGAPFMRSMGGGPRVRRDRPSPTLRCAKNGAPTNDGAPAHREPGGENANRWLWVLVAPFLAVTLLVSVVPPGFLWTEEGGGYDVLEYHLQLPKEYLERETIQYTPHNVYGAFPANVEMLYTLCMSLRGGPYDGAATAKILNALLAILFVFAMYVAGREVSCRVGVATGVIAAGVGWLPYLSGVAYVENGMLLFSAIAVAGLIRAGGDQSSPPRLGWYILAGIMVGFACGCKYTALPLVAAPLAFMAIFVSRGCRAVRIRSVALFGLAALAGFSPWMAKNTWLTGNPVFPLAGSVFQSYPAGWGESESLHFAASHQPDPTEASFSGRVRQIPVKIVTDPKQRFGPLLFLLPVMRLLSRRRSRLDLFLLAVFILQLLGWTFATHLYARFAVPMIIPLVILAGRSFEGVSSGSARLGMYVVLIAGLVFSGGMTMRQYASHLYANGRKIPLEGADTFFLDGLGGGHEHLSVINHKLESDARILMLGDARAFYFKARVDYCVVFNRNPFAEVVAAARSDEEIVQWLRDSGYTHVFVNWAEVSRLRRSRYGFAEEIQPVLFERLAGMGVERTEVFSTGDLQRPYAELYSVSP